MSEEKIGQVINFLCQRSLLDSTLWASDKVLTSHGMQVRFQEAIRNRAQKTPRNINPQYWLLDEEETESYIKLTQNSDSSEKKGDSSEKNNDNSEKKDTKESKVNKSKVNKRKEEERKPEPTAAAEGECLNSYEKYIGIVTPAVAEGIEHYLSLGVEKELIIRLIEYASEKNARNWQYINAALIGNLNAGIKTLDAYKRNKADYVGAKSKSSPQKRTKFNNYDDVNVSSYADVNEQLLANILEEV